ncbi:MAG: 30S ribosomal protein S2 [Candidatus Sungbacteria bacterium]|uniref:Small ribosomal subunit protein uS2 n=1 Tax=Candidatus Sungiibacteriota bacterium TaxID=2750080 RepID=A0A931SDQ2_9BACT|nr:30S ribosomal protein S2 [Candidatus Sungbacteria bacterium]
MIWTDEADRELKVADALQDEIQALMKAGAHIGHVKSKTHPAMRPFIFTTRNNIEIIDVLKTAEYLAKAETFLRSVAARGGMALWVGTKPSARQAVEGAAAATNMPHVTGRWIGGLLTNFRVISRQVAEMEDIEKRKANRDLEKYTKQERARIDDKYQSLLKVYGGLRLLRRLPDAVIIIDTVHDHIAVGEARRMKIPIVALVDTNTDPRPIQYPVPSNDDVRLAVQYMTHRMAEALKLGVEEATRAAATAKAEKDKAEAATAEEKTP